MINKNSQSTLTHLSSQSSGVQNAHNVFGFIFSHYDHVTHTSGRENTLKKEGEKEDKIYLVILNLLCDEWKITASCGSSRSITSRPSIPPAHDASMLFPPEKKTMHQTRLTNQYNATCNYSPISSLGVGTYGGLKRRISILPKRRSSRPFIKSV
jgi:hypothetical protein